MEHREPPRIAPGDRRFDGAIGEPEAGFRLRAFVPAQGRRHLGIGRAGLLAVFGIAMLAGVLFLVRQATRGAVGWLHHQSRYQVPFREIRLATEPPPWYRGGGSEFLERVRQGAGEDERFSLLDVGPERLTLAFKKNPWVEDVIKVGYAPGRVVVELRYRWPVAWVDLPQKRIVDQEAIILPHENIDPDLLGRLIMITGDGLAPPADPRAGVIWKTRTGANDLGETDRRIEGAAKLAGFLKRQSNSGESPAVPALLFREIIVTDFERRGLFIVNEEGAEVCWGSAPGDERPGRLTAERKWTMLREWQQSTRSRCLPTFDYWAFSRAGLYHVCPHPRSSHAPTEVPRVGKNRPTDFAKPAGSG
jgi:hypothetical protein